MPLITGTASETASQTEEFSGFYTAHFGRIAGQLYAYLGDRWEAQDLTQEAFCRAFQRWDSIGTYDRPEAWVRQVAWNLATNRLRHLRAAMRHLAGQRVPHTEGPNPDRVVLTAALAKLPPKHRLAVVLHHLAQLSTSEIAEQQNVAEGTVRSWLSRGRTQLAEQLTEQLTEIPRHAPAIPAPGIADAVARVRRRRTARRATVAAAIAIVVALSAAIILRGKGSEPPFIGPTTPPSNPTPTPSPSAPTARQTIAGLAMLAERAPTPPQPRSNQLILAKRTHYTWFGGDHRQERWLDPDGAIMLRYRSFEMGIMDNEQTEKQRARWISEDRANMAKVGPGLSYPNWTVLSTYTTDPQALLNEVSHGRNYDAATFVSIFGDMAENLDALAPPQLKAALVRMLGLVDGVTAEQTIAPDGTPVWAIGGPEGTTRRKELLVNATTGLIVGYRTVDLVRNIYTSPPCRDCKRWPRPIPSPIPPTPSDTIMWTTTLVTR